MSVKVYGGSASAGSASSWAGISSGAQFAPTSSLPSVPSSQVKAPDFGNVGKFNANLFDIPAPPKFGAPPASPAATGQLPFHGVPLIGNVFEAGATFLGSEALGDILPGIGQIQRATRESTWEKGINDPARAQFEKNVAEQTALQYLGVQAMAEGKISHGQAAAQYMRYVHTVENPEQALLADVGSPGGVGIAAELQSVLGLLGLPQRGLQRTIAGATDRVGALMGASDEELLKNAGPTSGAALIDIKKRYAAGELTKSGAMDELIMSGFGTSNPLGGGIGTLGSLTTELLSDPLTILTVATGGLSKVSTVATRAATRAITETAGEDAVRAFAGRAGLAGLKATPQATLDAMIRDPEMLVHVEAAMKKLPKATQFLVLDAPRVIRIGNKINRMLDPLSLFGHGDAGALVAGDFSRRAAAGVVAGHGGGSVRRVTADVSKALGKDVADVIDEAFATTAANRTLQAGNELSIINTIRSGSLAMLEDPTATARMMAEKLGKNITSTLQDQTDRIRLRVVPLKKGGLAAAMTQARTRAVDQIMSMAPTADRAAVERIAGKWGERELGYIDDAHYGHVVGDLLKIRNAASSAIRDGLQEAPAIAPDQVTFLAPRQLTRQGLETLRQAFATNAFAKARAIIEQHNDLYTVLDTNLTDAELKKLALGSSGGKTVLDQIGEHLPSALEDVTNVSPEFQQFLDTYGPMGYKLGLKPADNELARAIYDESDRLVGVNPWIDLTDEKMVHGAVTRMGVVKNALFSGISGRTVLRDAENRFVQQAAERFGLTEVHMRSVFRVISTEAQRQKLTGARGLTTEDMYRAAMSLNKSELPQAVRNKMTQRDVASLVMQAHEGSLSVVGLTQKLSGIAKSISFETTHSNGLGILAEQIYPALKFSKNVAFIVQELVETPMLMLMRGQLPITDFRRVWTSGGRKSIGREVDEALWAMNQTMRSGAKTHLDMMEYNGLVMGGDHVIGQAISRFKVLDRIPTGGLGPKMHSVKEWGEARSWQFNMGRRLQKAIESSSPDSWNNWAEWQIARFGKRNDNDAISHFIVDAVARTDPDSVYSQFGHAAFRPAWVGARSRVSDRFIRWAVTGDDAREGAQESATKWQALVDRVRNPEDSLTADDVHSRLLELGADPDYAERAVASVTMPSADQWWATWKDLGRSDAEIAVQRTAFRAEARARGMTERELLIHDYVGAPMSIDELGNHRGPTQFQAVADSLDAAGRTTLPADDTAHWDGVREAANAKLPRFERAAEGTPATARTDSEAKAQKWGRAYDALAEDPSTGASAAVMHEIGPNGERTAVDPVFRTADGKLQYKLGEPTVQELRQFLDTHVPSKHEALEYAAWYDDMRRGLSALVENDPQRAAERILGFATTQTNASPEQGMRLLFRATALLRRGGDITTEINAVSDLDQLLRALTSSTELQSMGLGQKLLDFTDSLLGNETRTAGFHGPDPARPWGPWAQDVWMQRFMGHIDPKMSGHLRRILGAESVTLGDDGFTVVRGGKTFLIPKEAITQAVPSPAQYAHAVKLGNELTDHLNTVGYHGRTDWKPREVQALGWAATKRAMAGDNGNVLSAIMRHRYDANYDIVPTSAAPLRSILPYDELAPATRAVIDSGLARHADREAEDLIGTHALPMTDMGGKPTSVVMADAADAQAHAVVAAYLQQADEVVGYGAKDAAEPAFTVLNDYGVNPNGEAYVDWLRSNGYGGIADTLVHPDSPVVARFRAGAEALYQQHAPRETAYFRAERHAAEPGFAARSDALTGADIQRAYDTGDTALGQRLNVDLGVARGGSAESGGAVRAAPAAPPATHVIDANGFRRGRFVEPAEYRALHAEGRSLLNALDSSPTTPIAANLDNIAEKAQAEIIAPWGGATFDAHTGQLLKSDAMYHGTMAQFSPSIEQVGINRGHFINDVRTARSYTPPGAQFRVYRTTRAKLQGGQELAPGWMENPRVGAADLEVLRSDTGQFEPVVPGSVVGSGPFTSAYGDTLSIPVAQAADPVAFRSMFDEFIAANRAELEKEGRQIGVFHNVDTGQIEININVTVATEREAEALQLAANRQGGAYDHWTGNGVFAPVQRVSEQYFQRSKKGILAATQMDGQRARVFVDPHGRRPDTFLHERGHQVLERMDPSAKLQIKRAYAEEQGATSPAPARLAPGEQAPTPRITLTDAEHEWFVDNYIAYHRTGEPPSPELKPLFDHYGQSLRRMKKVEPNPEVRSILDGLTPKRGGTTFGHNVDQQQLLSQMVAQSSLASRNARDFIHFNTNRSWLQRSLNHPFLGLYPLSYMWGKVLPEFVQFMAFKPFGFDAPAVGFLNTLKGYQYVMQQQEHDKEFRDFMTKNEPAFRGLAMLLPALPWDLPVNAAYIPRHVTSAIASQIAAEQAGKVDKDGNPVHVDLTKIDWGKIATGAAAYSFDPTKGPSQTAGYLQGLKSTADLGWNAAMGNNWDGSGQTPEPVPAPTTPDLPDASTGTGNVVADALHTNLQQSGDKLLAQLASPTP